MTSEYGFKCSFNPTFTAEDQTRRGWISRGYYGLDQGPIVMWLAVTTMPETPKR